METENSNGAKNEYDVTNEEYPREEFDVEQSNDWETENPYTQTEHPETDEETEAAEADEKPEGKLPDKEKKRRTQQGEFPPQEPLSEPERALIIPHRKLLKVVRYLARSNKAALMAGILTITVGVMFAIAYMQEHMGQFTINLNRVDMWRRAISMSETSDFADPTSRLVVNTIRRTTNISIEDIPWDSVDEGDGDKSGKDYIAYSFYIRNGGIEDVDCGVKLNVDYKSKGAENAIRITLFRDGERTIYAMPAADGSAEPMTVPFVSDTLVMEDVLKDFKVDDVHKYTIVMWIEGDDPECLNDIIGGSVRFSMDFDTGESKEVSIVELIKNLPLFRGAIEDDSLGSKDEKEGLWDEGTENESSQQPAETIDTEQN